MNKHGRMGTKMSRCLFQAFALLCALAASSAPAASLYFVHTDHLGTPQKITDGAQQVVWEGSPMPFGETEVVVNQIDFRVRFPGQYFDGEAGLHYNYFRDYDPSLGRYVQSDPIGLDGGINTYAYVENNPLILIDPYGLWSVTIKGYYGKGGYVSFGRGSSGKWFALGGAGVGLGAGINLQPEGDFPKPKDGTEFCGSEGYVGFQGDFGASFGPFSAGVKGQTGGIIGTSSQGDTSFAFTESGGFSWSLKGKRGWGVSLGGGVAAGGGLAFGDDGQCGCPQ